MNARILLTVVLFGFTCHSVYAQEFHTSVAPLPNEDILRPCQYDLTLPTSKQTIAGVWVIFDRGTDYVNFYHDPQVKALGDRFHFALMLAHHCRSKEREDMIVDPQRGIGRALFQAVKQFAADTNHPEVSTSKLLLVGFSGAGSLVARLPGYAPDRILASVAYAPGQYAPLGMDTIELSGKADLVPQFIIANGADDHVGTARPYDFFRKYWDRGAPWTFVIQNRTPHCCLPNAKPLILSWVEDVLRAKSEFRQKGELGFIRIENSGIRDGWNLPVSNITSARLSTMKGHALQGELPSGWLPDKDFAREWLSFAERTKPR